MKNLHLKIKSFIFALTLFLLHVEEAKGIAINAMPLTMPQHLMRHFYFMGKRPEIGEKNFKLTVVQTRVEYKGKKSGCLFACECGSEIIRTIGMVRIGNTKSCGCLWSKTSKPKAKYKIDEQIKMQCISDYMSGMTYEEVGEKYKVSNVTVFNWVKERHVGRGYSEACRVYDLNEDAFRDITRDTLYWAGFIGADGCVFNYGGNKKKLRIELQNADIDHLMLFRDFIGSTSPFYYDKKETVALEIYSAKIVDDLAKFGIHQNKQLVYKPTETCLTSSDFWRGMVDGDGGVYMQDNTIRVMLCGSKEVVDGFLNWAKSFTSTKVTSADRKGNKCYITYINGVHAERIAQRFYDNESFSLKRKKDVFTDFMINNNCKELYI